MNIYELFFSQVLLQVLSCQEKGIVHHLIIIGQNSPNKIIKKKKESEI